MLFDDRRTRSWIQYYIDVRHDTSTTVKRDMSQ